MNIVKNEIPILEFDGSKSAVVEPTHEKLGMILPEKAVFAFLGDCIDEYAKKIGAEKISQFVSATKLYPLYITEYKGEKICFIQAPVGAAPASQILDWLIGYGAKKIISAGSCGALEDIPENVFIVPKKALRDEGTSYHYAPPSRYIETDETARAAIKKALVKHGLGYREVTTWSTDGFYRETAEMVAYRKDEGCSVVEMECSALASCAKFRDAVWGEILFTADSLADIKRYEERSWGKSSFEYALELCFDSVINL